MITEILKTLELLYPHPATGLHHNNPYELLVATILSAQCTDERVNQITPTLFVAYPSPYQLADASFTDVASYIKTAGLWRNKAQNLIKTAKILVAKHNGHVPNTREELEALPGVGRKTASVVLANAFGIPAIAVDTHVFRVANRLGIVTASTPIQTEKALMEVIPKKLWIAAHHWLILHGRALCKARRPLCSDCPLKPYCAFFQNSLTDQKPG